MRFLKKAIPIIILTLITALPVVGQKKPASSPGGEKAKKVDTEKKQEEREKEKQEAIRKGKKQHMSIQTEKTRKRMRRSRKKSQRLNKRKRKFFLIRWYEKLRHKLRR